MKQIYATHITLPEGLTKRQIKYCLYVDLTILGIKEMVGNKEYPCVSNIDDI